MASKTSSMNRTLIIFGLMLVTLSSAQLTGLPTLTTDNVVLGATSTSGSKSSSHSTSTASTGSKSAASTSNQSSASSTVTSSDATNTNSASFAHLSALPTIYGVGVPPLIVPDTSNAPFMQKSDFPEGFVFICVGAILAFLGLSVIAWRAMVAFSLRRSVRRAAADRYVSEKKSMYGAPTNYSSVYQSANVSLEHLASKETSYHNATANSGSTQRLSKAQPKPSKRVSSNPNPAGSSLFFSPTAGSGQGQRSNRTSTYLPSGYYASGASALAGGAGVAHLGGPPAAGYGRVGEAFSDSPPTTPGLRPQSAHRPDHNANPERLSYLDVNAQDRSHQRSRSNLRTSTDLLSGPEPSQRAPSAVLDELFEHHTSMR